MKPRRSEFTTQVEHRPRRLVVQPEASATLRREVALRPARFVVGLDAWLAKEAEPPASVHAAAEIGDRRFYVGRVEEVAADGAVIATIWECPSGGEAQATLQREHFRGEPAISGDGLRILTWVELSASGERTEHVQAEVVRRPWTEAERAELDQILALLEEDKASE